MNELFFMLLEIVILDQKGPILPSLRGKIVSLRSKMIIERWMKNMNHVLISLRSFFVKTIIFSMLSEEWKIKVEKIGKLTHICAVWNWGMFLLWSEMKFRSKGTEIHEGRGQKYEIMTQKSYFPVENRFLFFTGK